MILWLRQWLLRLTGTAILCAAALTLVPEGTAKKSVQAVCAVVTVCALLSGFTTWDGESYAVSMATYRKQAEEIAASSEDSRNSMLRSCIEEKCGSYIWDKATKVGLAVTEVQVQARWSEEGCWVPNAVKIVGKWQETEKEELSVFLQGEMGVQPENVQWDNTDEVEKVDTVDKKE